MLRLSADIPPSLRAALAEEAARTGRSTSAVVTAALAQYLERPIHTVFQVSTSGALVAGVYDREVSVQTLLEHGNLASVRLPTRTVRWSSSTVKSIRSTVRAA